MQISIKGRNLEVTDALTRYIETRVGKLERFLSSVDEARVDLSVQNTKSQGDRHVVQLTLRANGTILRAEDRSSDVRVAVDSVMDKMTRQIERYKGKHWRSLNRVQTAEVPPEEREGSEGDVVRIKRFQTRPMDVDEAIEQMELLSHDFFVFYDSTDGRFSVVYRRHDGGYGLLIPELA